MILSSAPSRTARRTAGAVAGILLASAIGAAAAPQSTARKQSMPLIFNARASVGSAEGRGDVYITIQIDKYTHARDLKTMEEALRSGGTDAFLLALRKTPVAGRLRVGDQSFAIRWARTTPTARGQIISLVTDAPVYFVGGGVPGAKPRAGYDVAVIKLTMDSSHIGEGAMAAAARVKPGGDTGVEIQDYGSAPIVLRSVMQVIS